MPRIRKTLIHAAAAASISACWSAGPSFAAPAATPTGKDLYHACFSEGDAACEVMIKAAAPLNRKKMLERACPPIIRSYGAAIEEVRDYLARHPEAADRPAADIIFDAETETLSRANGTDCSAQ